MSLPRLAVYTRDQLEAIVEEATIDQTQNEWVAKFLATVADLVKRKPLAYRTFGPWWWPLKQQLQLAGLMNGEPVDETLVDQVTTGSVALDLAGAFAYQEWLSASPQHIGNTFTVDTEDGDTLDYVLVDEEMEL